MEILLIIIGLIIVLLPLFLFINAYNPFWRKTIVKTMRFILGFLLMGAGLMRFTFALGLIGPVFLIAELEKHKLGLYGEFISLSEVVIGFLQMTNRFGTLGAIMAIPMFLNILVVVTSLQWNGTPVVVSVLLFWNILVLLDDWHKIKFILTDDIEPLKSIPIKRENIKLDIIYGVFFLLIMLSIFLGIYNKDWSSNLSKLVYLAMFITWLMTRIQLFRNRK